MQSEAAAKLELWFFRDMLESNRLRLFELFGFKPSEMDTMVKQQMVFRRILAALYAAEPAKTAPAVAVNDDMRKEFAASARAMFLLAANGPDDDLRDGMRELYARMFRVLNGLSPSALSAQVQDVAVPAGWKLVPVEPTPEMVGAWYRYKNGHHWPDEQPPSDTSDYGAYRAMLAASPTPPAEKEGGE